MGKVNLLYGSRVELEGGVIRWDNHTCFITALSQIWIGKPYGGKWGIAKEESEGLNVELISGNAHSFISSDHEFLEQAYELICSMAEKGGCKGKHTIDFEHYEIQIYEEPEEELPEPEPEPEPEPVFKLVSSNPLKQELETLMEYCKNKEDGATAILQLLEGIGESYDGTRRDVQELYKLFIQLSLINDCNELGLNLLINDVKAHVFGT